MLCVSLPAPAAVRVYVANDDHTDYLWSADTEAYRAAFIGQLDYYLSRVQATLSEETKNQARFTADGMFWLWEYERNKTPVEFENLMARVKDGHISVMMNPLVSCFGAQPAEAVLRGMYYAGDLERRFDLRFSLAQAMENQTLPFGLASLWAGAGAKYTWQGQCGCATKIPAPFAARPHEMYWWEGLDGSRILTKWYRLEGNQNFGGYAEANQSDSSALDLVPLRNKAASAGYPYEIVGVFGKGWDYLYPNNPNSTRTAQFETAAKNNADVYSSNEVDFFQDFEANYGALLPVYAASFGNEWDLLCASLAETTGRVRRAVEKLRAAEAMAALVSLHDPSFMSGREEARARAWMDLGLYYEHDWTGDGGIPREERADWQRERMVSFESYVNDLAAAAASALAGMIRKTGPAPRFFAFNPLSWTRSDRAEIPFADTQAVHVIDLAAGIEVPSQIVAVDGERRLRILASGVPPVGYKVFEVRPGAGQSFSPAASAAGGASGMLENEFYRLTLSNRGAVTSLLDKGRGNREFVRGDWNGMGAGAGTVAVENAGAVSASLVASGANPAHAARITFLRGSDRIEVQNEITENFSAVQTWYFGFDLDDCDLRHEEVGAVIRAKTLGQGGQYCGDANISRYDWQTLNHFADISGGGVGATLSNIDCCFMKLGASAVSFFDATASSLSVLSGGQVDGTNLGIQNQGGDSYFLQRFALKTHGSYDETAAMKFALEHANPLVAETVTGGSLLPATVYSFLSISHPDVLAWAVKPAEEGVLSAGIVVRVWNMGSAGQFSLSLPGREITSALRTTHIETPLAEAGVSGGVLSSAIPPRGMLTFSLRSRPLPYGGLSRPVIASGDYDGNGTTEIAVFRPSAGLWAIRGLTAAFFGTDGDLPVSGDYRGEGRTGIALFRPSSGLWSVRGLTRFYWGGSGDAAVPSDYDGNGTADSAVFRPADGSWAVRGLTRAVFGAAGDQPVPADYDGDGTGEIALFRPSSGLWADRGRTRFFFGGSDDVPVPSDYSGDGTLLPAVFRSSAGLWSARNLTRFYLGIGGDDPVPADYDGDSTAAAGIFRGSAGLWSVRALTRAYWGSSGDLPLSR